jgi:pyridoxal phosphate enzyme (YggS family)
LVDDEQRQQQLAAALASVRQRIGDACARADRDPETITLIAVTKTYPAEDAVRLLALGVRELGESRDQEAAAKAAETDALLDDAGNAARPCWHFVGQLQRRKSKSVVGYASAVHSVDRMSLATSLADAVSQRERNPIDVFVQVSLDGDPARGGVTEDRLHELVDAVAERAELNLRGVMAVAPMEADPERAFADLREISARVTGWYPYAFAISAGMSGDLEAAIQHGATHVRVGTALLGRRAQVFG